MSLYTSSQICMHCLTDPIFLLVAVVSIIKNLQSALLYRDFRQSFESDYHAFSFLQPCCIQNLWTPQCSRLWSLQKMNWSLFVSWVTSLCKSSLMFGGLQWMLSRISLVLRIILDMCLRGDSIYTAALRRQASLAAYLSFVIKFFAIHRNMGPG